MSKSSRSVTIAGLDIGTTKTCAVVASSTPEGLDIIGVGEAPSTGLRKGIITDLEETVRAIEAATVGDTRIDDPRFTIVHASYAAMRSELAARGVGAVQGVLLDLGVSSPQIDEPARGFSFRFDAPLDMRMDSSRGETAAEFLARADERLIAQVIKDYGEERFAVRIAKTLVARREAGAAVRTTAELASLVAARANGNRGAVKLSPYVAQKLEAWSRHWSLDELVALQARLAELDFGFKQTPLLPLGMWTEIVTSFCR